MKPILYLSIILLSFQTLATSPDSLWAVANIDNLQVNLRWKGIANESKQLSSEAKKEWLLFVSKKGETNKWPEIQAEAEKELGEFFYITGDYTAALEHYQKALISFEKLNASSGQGKVYQLLATLSKKQKDYKRAQTYLNKSLELCIQIKDSSCISTVYDNRGLIYAELGDFKKAKEQYLITLGIRQRLKDTIGLGYVYSNLAEVASNEKAFELAEQYLIESNVYKLLSADQFGQAVNRTNLGELFFKQEKYRQAADFFQQSLQMSDQLGIPDLSQWNCHYLSRCYSNLGNTHLALDFLNQSHQLKDSLLTVQKLSQITEMETRFDTERKEQQIKLQELKITTQGQQNRIQLILGVLILSLLVFSFGLFIMRYKSQQKNKLQEAKISYQQQLLNRTLETQEQERIRISKDLHDGIGQQLSGLKMAWQQLGKSLSNQLPEKSERIEELSQVLGTAADEVRSISHQMMPKSLQEYGLIPAVEDLLNTTFKNSSIEYDFEHFGIKERLSQNIELSTFRILQELINNIIKHAHATEVGVQIMKNNNRLILVVEDNGRGMSEDALNKSGHGMQNIQSRAQLVQGSFDLENKNPGTLATLRIPLSQAIT